VLNFASTVFFFVSTVLNFASTVFFFGSTVLNFASTVFFFVSTVLNFVSTVFFFKSYVTIAPPHPPASIHVLYTFTIVGGGGLSPLPLNTCSHNIATRRPPHPSNMQQHTTTHKNTQQQTTTHNNSTQQHSGT
jgi:hypothetical protein